MSASCCTCVMLYLLCLQHLAALCSVVTECIGALAVDFWLQTHMHQCGVLWHLLLFLFNYDYTLEEGGVERSDQTNQQVAALVVCQNHSTMLFTV